uniref:Uncharacterized protein n=1 Tax=Anguilla anguilla TaxID=7936 RepID=A0A0E9RMT4_ANGAN
MFVVQCQSKSGENFTVLFLFYSKGIFSFTE